MRIAASRPFTSTPRGPDRRAAGQIEELPAAVQTIVPTVGVSTRRRIREPRRRHEALDAKVAAANGRAAGATRRARRAHEPARGAAHAAGAGRHGSARNLPADGWRADLGDQRQDDDRGDVRLGARPPGPPRAGDRRRRTSPTLTSALLDAARWGGRSTEIRPVRGGRVPDGHGRARAEPVVLWNLFRDQLDRYGELETIADRWAAMVAGCDRTALALNADDPLIADLGRERGESVTSASRPVAGDAEMQHASDSKHCRNCGAATSTRPSSSAISASTPARRAAGGVPTTVWRETSGCRHRSASFSCTSQGGCGRVSCRPGLYSLQRARRGGAVRLARIHARADRRRPASRQCCVRALGADRAPRQSWRCCSSRTRRRQRGLRTLRLEHEGLTCSDP